MPSTLAAFSGNDRRQLRRAQRGVWVYSRAVMDHCHVQPRQENICQLFLSRLAKWVFTMSTCHHQAFETDRESTEALRQTPTMVTIVDNMVNFLIQVCVLSTNINRLFELKTPFHHHCRFTIGTDIRKYISCRSEKHWSTYDWRICTLFRSNKLTVGLPTIFSVPSVLVIIAPLLTKASITPISSEEIY